MARGGGCSLVPTCPHYTYVLPPPPHPLCSPTGSYNNATLSVTYSNVTNIANLAVGASAYCQPLPANSSGTGACPQCSPPTGDSGFACDPGYFQATGTTSCTAWWVGGGGCMRLCVCACVGGCTRACVGACVQACVHVRACMCWGGRLAAAGALVPPAAASVATGHDLPCRADPGVGSCVPWGPTAAAPHASPFHLHPILPIDLSPSGTYSSSAGTVGSCTAVPPDSQSSADHTTFDCLPGFYKLTAGSSSCTAW